MSKKRKISAGVPENTRSESPPTVKALTRCEWASEYAGAGSKEYIHYHDTEWGRPVHDDKILFEFLVLEGAQAGLSWATILKKRSAYRTAFKGFDIDAVTAFGDKEVEALLAPESGIVRHRGKIKSAINNAKLAQEIVKEHGSFSNYMWSTFLPNGKPIVNKWTCLSQVPSKSDLSGEMSKTLKKRGFNFVGPTTCYSFMQAVGMVNDHIAGCFCYSICCDLGR
eukprot:CAMPEP_0177756658 /NCGR_PEP_ID=MMETSP0491_2-20121128/3228_1 /TAXON_ID=63592 /ORGANISM="Tetraselmis chuii, Strain PLY429" /LENGTH=223 /DNA_ID=CAMNT_0019272259 /DNA_START=267 /DNA_END=938 /DNA_ORIENTATION=-